MGDGVRCFELATCVYRTSVSHMVSKYLRICSIIFKYISLQHAQKTRSMMIKKVTPREQPERDGEMGRRFKKTVIRRLDR